MTLASAAPFIPVHTKHSNELTGGDTGDTTMQQTIYNSINSNSINSNGITVQATQTNKMAPTARRASLARHIARRWDMVGMLALMGSSAVYAVFALAHVGL